MPMQEPGLLRAPVDMFHRMINKIEYFKVFSLSMESYIGQYADVRKIRKIFEIHKNVTVIEKITHHGRTMEHMGF